MGRNDKLLRVLPWISTPLLLIAVLFGWKFVVASGRVSPYTLPAPEQVGTTLQQVLTGPDIRQHVLTTLTETVGGFAIGLFLAIVIGSILGRIEWLERTVRPLIVALQVIPKVALIPLFVIWFGFGVTSKVIMAAILAFFPMMLNVLLGVRSVDPGHRDVMRSLNASRWQTFRRLELHTTLPYVFAGMEVGIVFALIGAIVGEYLGGNVGLGYLIVSTLNALDAPKLFAVIILLAVLGSVLFLVVNTTKRFLIPWHESVNRSDIA
jgi:NitT/TauT family transport system permease protein